MVRAVDNKDRWIATVDLASATLQPRHRLTDPAWINWSFNDFGWLPDGAAVVPVRGERLLAPVRAATSGGAPRALTSGKWEVSAPQLSPDGSTLLLPVQPRSGRATTKSARSTATAARCAK